PGDLVLIKARPPQLARYPVAADIGADQVLELLAVVDVAAGDGRRLGVRKAQRRRQNRRRPAPAFGANLLRPFHDRPAVVAAALDAVNHLPQLPADVADPEIAGGRVDAHAPGVAEPVSPDLRPGPRRFHKWIVGGHGVSL